MEYIARPQDRRCMTTMDVKYTGPLVAAKDLRVGDRTVMYRVEAIEKLSRGLVRITFSFVDTAVFASEEDRDVRVWKRSHLFSLTHRRAAETCLLTEDDLLPTIKAR